MTEKPVKSATKNNPGKNSHKSFLTDHVYLLEQIFFQKGFKECLKSFIKGGRGDYSSNFSVFCPKTLNLSPTTSIHVHIVLY